jgi:hypothetical protein
MIFEYDVDKLSNSSARKYISDRFARIIGMIPRILDGLSYANIIIWAWTFKIHVDIGSIPFLVNDKVLAWSILQ